MDYIFINGRPYLFTKSAKINFHSIQECIGQGKVVLKKGLDIPKQTYEFRGFNITQYDSDNNVDKIRPNLLP